MDLVKRDMYIIIFEIISKTKRTRAVRLINSKHTISQIDTFNYHNSWLGGVGGGRDTHPTVDRVFYIDFTHHIPTNIVLNVFFVLMF